MGTGLRPLVPRETIQQLIGVTMKSKQRGFTLVELMTVIVFLIAVCGAGTVVWVAAHFIGKLW